MGWNYRVIRHRRTDITAKHRWVHWFEIHEAYYDDHGRIWAISKDGMGPHGETFAELRSDFAGFMAALQKPVLDEWKLPEKGAQGPCKGLECKRMKERKRGKRIR